MASVFYPVPETFRGRFRTDTSRRPYPISYPAGPDARSGFAGTNRHAPNPASRHTTAQTAGTPHTPKAKPPVFRQMLNPSDCSPLYIDTPLSRRHPRASRFPKRQDTATVPTLPRKPNRLGSVPAPDNRRITSAHPMPRYGKRTSRTRNNHPLIARYSSVIRTATDCQSDCPPPHFSPLLYSAGPIFRTLHTPTDSRPNRHFPCLSPTVAARILLLFPAAIIVAVCFIS